MFNYNRFLNPTFSSFLIFISTFISSITIIAQEYNWQIILNDNSEINNIIPSEIKENILIVKNESGFSEVEIEKISMMKKIVDSKFWSYAQYGALIGGGIVALITIKNLEDDNSVELGFLEYLAAGVISGGVGSIEGGLIGGIVGAAASVDEIHDFKGANINGKLTQINWILENKVK
jgi:hypothetical protein